MCIGAPGRNDSTTILQPQYLSNLLQTIAGDGDAAVDRRIQAEVIISGAARGKQPDAVQINNVFPVTLQSLGQIVN